jgi:hypothetical protein
MQNAKTCPKCETTMEAVGYEMALPAANDTRLSTRPISESAGIRVAPYRCPKCDFVELYFLSAFRPAV